MLRGFGCHGCGVALGRLSAAAATLYYFVWDVTSEGRGLSRPRFLVWVVCSSPHAHRSWAGQPMLDSISSQQLRVSGGSSPCQNNEVAHAVQQAWTSSGYKKSHPSLPAQAGFAGKLGRDSLKSGNTDPGEWLPIVLLALRRGQYGKTQRTSSGDSFEMLNLQATTQVRPVVQNAREVVLYSTLSSPFSPLHTNACLRQKAALPCILKPYNLLGCGVTAVFVAWLAA